MKNKFKIESYSQLDAYRSVRKDGLPQNQVERPDKGGAYKRHDKFRKNDWNNED